MIAPYKTLWLCLAAILLIGLFIAYFGWDNSLVAYLTK